MTSDAHLSLASRLLQLVAEAEAADASHSTVITRVRLAHAKSMYVRAMALEPHITTEHVVSQVKAQLVDLHESHRHDG